MKSPLLKFVEEQSAVPHLSYVHPENPRSIAAEIALALHDELEEMEKRIMDNIKAGSK